MHGDIRVTAAKLAKLSICPCGCHLLKDEIPLGTEYKIHLENYLYGLFICRDCRTIRKLLCVWVEARENSPAGYLPLEIFDYGATASS